MAESKSFACSFPFQHHQILTLWQFPIDLNTVFKKIDRFAVYIFRVCNLSVVPPSLLQNAYFLLKRRGEKPNCLMGKQDPEADAIAAALGAAAAAVGNPARRSSVEPTAAAQNTVRAAGRAFGIALCGAAVVAIPVFAPFPNIAAHVVYS